MSKGAGAAGQNALAITGTAQGQSNQAANTVLPIYQKWATNPTGLTQQQKSNMLTATGQTLGGATSGIVGQGNLTAARTNNAGGFDTAITDAARTADQQLADTVLGVENQDAQLQRQQQQQGVQGLQDIYGTANQTALNALGQYTNARSTGNAFTSSFFNPVATVLGHNRYAGGN